jgi:hypothetical protein
LLTPSSPAVQHHPDSDCRPGSAAVQRVPHPTLPAQGWLREGAKGWQAAPAQADDADGRGRQETHRAAAQRLPDGTRGARRQPSALDQLRAALIDPDLRTLSQDDIALIKELQANTSDRRYLAAVVRAGEKNVLTETLKALTAEGEKVQASEGEGGKAEKAGKRKGTESAAGAKRGKSRIK